MQRVARAPLRRTDAAFTGKEEAPDRSELNPGPYWSGNTGFEPARRIRLPSWPLGLLVDPRHDGGSQGGLPFSGLSTKKRIASLRDRWVKVDKVFRTSGQD